MSRIDSIFADLRARGQTALMPFITAGYPSLDATAAAIPAMEKAGASIVELGIPFSDPIADGPVIAASMHRALQAGVTPSLVFNTVREVRPRVNLGIVAMVSDSIVQRMDAETFVSRASESGFDGLIIPDIDVDAAEPISAMTRAKGMSFSLLIAPTTTSQRIARITALCSGFIYLLARVGITGERASGPAADLAQRIATIRQHTQLPIAVGFGIGSREHVLAVTKVADAVIVGSALVRRMGEAGDPVAAAASFVGELAGGLASRTAFKASAPSI